MGRGDVLLGALGGCAASLAVWLYVRTRLVRSRGGTYHAGMCKARPEMIEQYMQLHDHTWDEVMSRMFACNMRDFVVWLHEETNTMFHQFVYIGNDFDADMARVGADPVVRFWWTYCEPCQAPLHWTGPPPSQGGTGDPRHPGEWWSPLTCVNHCGAWAVMWNPSLGPNPTFEPKHPRGLTSTKDNPPPVHNRTGPASVWTSYLQQPFQCAP